ncbi:MAG: hypothetical protein ACYDD1_09370 [Caulobacteraceae bacterium]
MTLLDDSQGGAATTRAGRLRLAALVGLALSAGACHRAKPVEPTPAGAQLKVEMGKSTKLDPDAALRCFVNGQFVGMQTPPECAQKNGVAPGALDVGLDQSGALAAGAGGTHLQSLDKAQADSDADDNTTDDADADKDQPSDDAPAPRAADARLGDCLKYGRSGWVGAGEGVGLNVCARILFDRQCVGPGQAIYGRWGGQTLRVVPGRVEMSDNNRDFHPLLSQNPQDCSLPAQ